MATKSNARTPTPVPETSGRWSGTSVVTSTSADLRRDAATLRKVVERQSNLFGAGDSRVKEKK